MIHPPINYLVITIILYTVAINEGTGTVEVLERNLYNNA